MAIIENMYQAKTHLSRLVEQVLSGEEVILAKAGKPLVRLIPYVEEPAPLYFGLLKDQITIEDDFNAFSPEIEEIFEGYFPE